MRTKAIGDHAILGMLMMVHNGVDTPHVHPTLTISILIPSFSLLRVLVALIEAPQSLLSIVAVFE
jgi:hypothetical protein